MKIHSPFRALSLCSACLITLISAISAVGQTNYDDFFSNNGSFEFGSPAPPLVFTGGQITTNQITGWRISTLGGTPSWLEGSEAQDGNRYLRFSTSNSIGGWSVSASVDGASVAHTPLTLGAEYSLSFWAAGGPAEDNTVWLSLLMGSDVISQNFVISTYTQAEFNSLPGLQWTQYYLPFIATDTTFQLDIYTAQPFVSGQNSIVYLDNFSLTAVPEPSSMLLSAMAGLWLLLRRRNSREISAVL